jgi:hypothetical protein
MLLRRALATVSAVLAWSTAVLADEPASPPVPSASTAASAPPAGSGSPVDLIPPAGSGSPVDLIPPAASEAPIDLMPPAGSGPLIDLTPPARRARPIGSGLPAAPGLPKLPPSTETHLNRPMEVGLTIFTLTYLPCFVAGPLTEKDEAFPLMLPLFGPLITGELLHTTDLGWGFLGALAALQTVGAGLFAFGALLPSARPNLAADKKKTTLAFRAAPLVTPTAWGISAQGSF